MRDSGQAAHSHAPNGACLIQTPSNVAHNERLVPFPHLVPGAARLSLANTSAERRRRMCVRRSDADGESPFEFSRRVFEIQPR